MTLGWVRRVGKLAKEGSVSNRANLSSLPMNTIFKHSSGYTGSVKPKVFCKPFFSSYYLVCSTSISSSTLLIDPFHHSSLPSSPFILPPYLCSPAFSHLGHCATDHVSLQVCPNMAPHSQCQPGNTACAIYTMVREVYAGNSQHHVHLTQYSGTAHWSWQSLIW